MATVCHYWGGLYSSDFWVETVEFAELATILEVYSALFRVYRGGIRECVSDFEGFDGAIHIEVLLPAFVLGMVMKTVHNHSQEEERASSFISYLFMFLVGLSTPIFIGLETGGDGMPGWGMLIFHVIVVTILSNLGKMFPLFFYRDRKIQERLALSIGMFTRGEVGAGIIVIAMGYQLGGPALIISILSLVLNLVLTGFFVVAVKRISQSVYGVKE